MYPDWLRLLGSRFIFFSFVQNDLTNSLEPNLRVILLAERRADRDNQRHRMLASCWCQRIQSSRQGLHDFQKESVLWGVDIQVLSPWAGLLPCNFSGKFRCSLICWQPTRGQKWARMPKSIPQWLYWHTSPAWIPVKAKSGWSCKILPCPDLWNLPHVMNPTSPSKVPDRRLCSCRLVGVDCYSFEQKLFHIAEHIQLPDPPKLGPKHAALSAEEQLPALLVMNIQLPMYKVPNPTFGMPKISCLLLPRWELQPYNYSIFTNPTNKWDRQALLRMLAQH